MQEKSDVIHECHCSVAAVSVSGESYLYLGVVLASPIPLEENSREMKEAHIHTSLSKMYVNTTEKNLIVENEHNFASLYS